MVFIPYFQLFLDINKRTSRIIGSLPLVKHHLPVLSMIRIEKKKYIVAVLAIYEWNDVELLQDIWTENYVMNLENYWKYFG
jgi:Fic family protein